MKFKDLLLASLILTVIFGAVAIYFFSDRQNTQIRGLQFELDSTRKVLEIWQGQDGKQRAQTNVSQADIASLQASQRADIAELRKELGRAFKGLESVTKAQIVTSDSGKSYVTDTLIITKIVNGADTIAAKAFNVSDKWLKLKGVITKETLDYSYSIKNDIQLLTFYEKPKGIKNIFKPSILKVRMIAENPNTNFNSLQTIVVKPPAKKWYQTKGFIFGVGIIAGVICTTTIGLSTK